MHDPMMGVVMTSANTDHVGGLLTLRRRRRWCSTVSNAYLRPWPASRSSAVPDDRLVERRSVTLDPSEKPALLVGGEVGLTVGARQSSRSILTSSSTGRPGVVYAFRSLLVTRRRARLATSE